MLTDIDLSQVHLGNALTGISSINICLLVNRSGKEMRIVDRTRVN
jgi:hypothetical protein